MTSRSERALNAEFTRNTSCLNHNEPKNPDIYEKCPWCGKMIGVKY